MSGIPGGFTETRLATKEEQQICNAVKNKAEELAGKNFAVFTATKFRSQVVAGINYLIKVHVGGAECVHLLVFQPLPCEGKSLVLNGIQTSKHQDDELVPFKP
ncbi:cystatin-B-like [Acipenser oxyrinchus oxyrinchus]|uniref:Cystatin-B n=1 Tax=Acipenser oxyrinchus oxyrinchus TaxID=40147 RepID=A0AAD8CDX6_ACIOX|nr:cystatin-B-like [Acipenser oxyrinchus oxyrinchus]